MFSPSGKPTLDPSKHPTCLSSLIPNEVEILSLSTGMDVFAPLSGEDSLKDKTSPKYFAMDWIVN